MSPRDARSAPSADELLRAIAATELFGSLDDVTLLNVARGCALRFYRRGQTVLSEGDEGDSMFVVVAGLLTVSVAAGQGRLVLATLRPPDVFGEIAVLDEGLRSATITAAASSTLAILRRDTLIELLSRHPAITDALLRYLGRLVRRLTVQTSDLALLDLHGRVAKLLCQLAITRGTQGEDGSVVLDLPLTQSDLAAMVGGSRQSVNQILRTFERRGWVSMAGRVLVVRRRDLLELRSGVRGR